MSSINNSENHIINRGAELIFRGKKGKNQPELELEKFNFKKIFSFLKREIYFSIELKVTKKK